MIFFLHFIWVRDISRRRPVRWRTLAHEWLLINRMGTSLRQHKVKHILLEDIHRCSCLS
jgi:hypothetical protein